MISLGRRSVSLGARTHSWAVSHCRALAARFTGMTAPPTGRGAVWGVHEQRAEKPSGYGTISSKRIELDKYTLASTEASMSRQCMVSRFALAFRHEQRACQF
jgi:hypothetical protein